MSRRYNYLFAGAAFALYAATGAAFAQPASAPAPAGSPSPQVRTEVRVVRNGSDMTVERDGRTVIMRREGHRTDMAQHLRAVLQLRPNQEAALSAYVQAMKPPMGEHMLHADAAEAPKTTPERLAAQEKMMGEHMAAMRARNDATRRFYDQLDAGQKKAFDELHADGRMGGMHMVHMMGGAPPMPVPPRPPGA